MALLNSLFSGVSGLRNHQNMMDVIGNNISNVNTIGFKGSRVTFADTFNEFITAGTDSTGSSGGTNTAQIGLGTKVNSIDRDWNQGTFEQTGITTDLALQGNGMFILKSNGQSYYSRAGDFTFDSNGKLVNAQGAVVQGKVANGLGELPSGTALQDVIINKNMRLPATKTTSTSWGGNLQSSSTTLRTDIVSEIGNLATGTTALTYPTTAKNDVIYSKDGTKYNLQSNYSRDASGAWTLNYAVLDSAGTALTPPQTGSVPLTFDATSGQCQISPQQITFTDGSNTVDFSLNLSSLTNLNADTDAVAKIDKGETPTAVTSSVTIYDSLGTAHTLSMQFDHIDNNNWKWSVSVPSTDGSITNADTQGTITFNTDGTIQSVFQNGKQVTSTPPTPVINFTPSSGAEPQAISLDFGSDTSGVTQTSLTSQVASLKQNGSASASLSNLNIDKYGKIVGIFSNGTSNTLGQVMVATFKNLNGLVGEGDNMYSVAANSGLPVVDEPGERTSTTIQSGALEQSNVDLSEEFTKMIVAQRGFQANSKVITTADSLLQNIVNLIS